MRNHILAATFLLLGATILIPAQNSIEQGVIRSRDDFSNIKNRSLELERIKRESYKHPVENSTVKFPEIKEDFERLQKINSDVLQPVFTKSPSNYTAILKAATEINHRANRLNTNLFAPDEEKIKEDKKSTAPGDVKILIVNLDKNINRFVHSPIFQNLQVVNPKDSLQAQKDLETVIKISRLIKETSARIIKDGVKNQPPE